MDILGRAYRLAQEGYPKTSAARHAAFANTVATLVTGESGGYGGPSVREHVACRLLGGEGNWSFDQATQELLKPDGLIFGPLRQEHLSFWQSQGDICFDDDSLDVAVLNGDVERN